MASNSPHPTPLSEAHAPGAISPSLSRLLTQGCCSTRVSGGPISLSPSSSGLQQGGLGASSSRTTRTTPALSGKPREQGAWATATRRATTAHRRGRVARGSSSTTLHAPFMWATCAMRRGRRLSSGSSRAMAPSAPSRLRSRVGHASLTCGPASCPLPCGGALGLLLSPCRSLCRQSGPCDIPASPCTCPCPDRQWTLPSPSSACCPQLIYDKDTGKSRGYGFVSFSDERDASDALHDANNRDLDGGRIRVNSARGPPTMPDRAGGYGTFSGGRGRGRCGGPGPEGWHGSWHEWPGRLGGAAAWRSRRAVVWGLQRLGWWWQCALTSLPGAGAMRFGRTGHILPYLWILPGSKSHTSQHLILDHNPCTVHGPRGSSTGSLRRWTNGCDSSLDFHP